jgi:hypothetical protein
MTNSEPKNIISLGAGVQSSVMALMAAKGEITPMPDCAIFADTGWEPKRVHDWLDWLEKQLPFPVYRVNAGSLQDDLALLPLFKKDVLLSRNCTDRHKITPIIRKVREILGLKKGERGGKEVLVKQWIGISMDECQRMKPAQHKFIEHIWPLIDNRMTRNDCLTWMLRNNYPKPLKSSCIGCPYHDNHTWRDIKMNYPDDWANAVATDKKIRDGVRGVEGPLYLSRCLKPLEDIDFRNLEDMGQQTLEFGEECSGLCGV